MHQVKAHKAEIIAQLTDLSAQQSRAEQAPKEPQNFYQRLTNLSAQLMQLGKDAKDAIDKVDLEAQQTRADIVLDFELRNTEITKGFDEFKGKAGPPGLGGGLGSKSSDGGSRERGIDKNKVSVWKLLAELDKTAFRYWVDAVDLQLEPVHGLKFAIFVLNHVRHAKVAVDQDVLELCIAAANADIAKAQAEMKIDPIDGDDLGHPID